MIASTFIFIFKIVAVVGLIAAMSIMLIGIRRFLTDSPEIEETDSLRKEVESDETVVSSHSLFHQFLTTEEERPRHASRRRPD